MKIGELSTRGDMIQWSRDGARGVNNCNSKFKCLAPALDCLRVWDERERDGIRVGQGSAFLITDPYLMENCRFDYFVQNAETEQIVSPYKVIDN